MANGATTDYRLFLATTSGFFALENAAGQVFIYPSGRPHVIAASQALALWSCEGQSDPRPAGKITALDCRDLQLKQLDVRRQAALRTLDCSGNQLTELDLSGLASLENLYCQGNPFVTLDLSPCPSLTFVRYVSRFLGYSESALASLSNAVCHDSPIFSFLSRPAKGLFNSLNDTRCAAKYISPRTRPITDTESRIRDRAYALKRAAPDAIAIAAPAMAALIQGPCWLVPIPASDCSLDANLSLSRAIAGMVPGARVKIAVHRTEPVESSTVRRRHHQFGLAPHEHHFVRVGGPINPLPLYFVDNVITTGNTIRAARSVIGWGTGLAYADASSPFNSPLSRAARAPAAMPLSR